MLNPMALEEKQGIVIRYEDRWLGTPGGPDRRFEPDTDHVRGIQLILDAEEWCSLVMSEGDAYIGGCCGNASQIQSTVTGIFHDGGEIGADTLYVLGEQVRTHPDGFDDTGFFVDFDQETFDAKCGGWNDMGPWDKLGLAYRAVADRIRPYKGTVKPEVERDPLAALVHSTNLLSFWSWLSKDGPDTKTGQRHANHALTIAKMLPGTRKLLALLESNLDTWSGVAIVRSSEPTEICSNGLGLCLYDSAVHAESVLKAWADAEASTNASSATAPTTAPDAFLVRDVRLTTRDGIEFL